MELQARMPSLHALIAEAKRRMRRRRFVLAITALLVIAAGLTFGLRPFGGAPLQRASAAENANHDPTAPTVPFNLREQHWQAKVRHLGGAPVDDAGLRDRLTTMVHDSGASVVRLITWRGTSPEAVELVVATKLVPAVYYQTCVGPLMQQLQYPFYFRAVDRHGSRIAEQGGAGNVGFGGGPHAIYSPCPVR